MNIDPQQLIQQQYRAIREAALALEGSQVSGRFQAGIQHAIASNSEKLGLSPEWQLAEFKRLHAAAQQIDSVRGLTPEESALMDAIVAAGLPKPESLSLTEAPSLYRAKLDPGATVADRKIWSSDAVYAVACQFAKNNDRVSAKFAPLVTTADDGDLLIDFSKRQSARQIAHFSDYITPAWIERHKGRFLLVAGVRPDGQLLVIDRRNPGNQSTLRGGMSGSGKSMLEVVDLHVQTLLLGPDELHLWLSDPHAGLSPYEGLPHLHGRTIATDAISAFQNAYELVGELNRRKSILQSAAIDNVDDLDQPLPYCLGKFDEFSGTCDDLDLELETIADRYPQFFRWQDGKDGESRLAPNNPKPSTVFIKLLSQVVKQGRKYGVHADFTEQNPKVDILPSSVKSELVPIALKMKNGAGSRVIIDSVGAEKLLGKGDAIISLNGETIRIQVLFPDPEYDQKLRGKCRENRGKSGGMEELIPDWWETPGNLTAQGFPQLRGISPDLDTWLENPQNGGASSLVDWFRSEVDRDGRSAAIIALIEKITGSKSRRRYSEFIPVADALLMKREAA
jgi:FtsK/SpoIIIE family